MLKERKISRLPPKTCWLTYGLQDLNTEKFLKVVQKILDGKLILLRANETGLQNSETTQEYFLTQI